MLSLISQQSMLSIKLSMKRQIRDQSTTLNTKKLVHNLRGVNKSRFRSESSHHQNKFNMLRNQDPLLQEITNLLPSRHKETNKWICIKLSNIHQENTHMMPLSREGEINFNQIHIGSVTIRMVKSTKV
jgi:hypothetical protein